MHDLPHWQANCTLRIFRGGIGISASSSSSAVLDAKRLSYTNHRLATRCSIYASIGSEKRDSLRLCRCRVKQIQKGQLLFWRQERCLKRIARQLPQMLIAKRERVLG